MRAYDGAICPPSSASGIGVTLTERVYVCVYVTTIRLSDEAKERLDLHKREGESYDDVIRRLTRRDKWNGFGIVDDDPEDVRQGLERIRDEANDAMIDDISEDQ